MISISSVVAALFRPLRTLAAGKSAQAAGNAMVIAALLVFCGALSYSNIQKKERAATYFGNTLAAHMISETVFVDEAPYIVEGDDVRDSAGMIPLPSMRYRALRTAYELTLAKRSPHFNLSGTDTTAVRENTRSIEDIQNSFAGLQATDDYRRSVEALYPIDFLRALADAEDARRTFLRTGSENDAARYRHAVAGAADAGINDIARFEQGYARAQSGSLTRIAIPSGFITTESMAQTAQDYAEALRNMQSTLLAERACFRGMIRACDPERLALQLPPMPSSLPSGNTSLAREIQTLLVEGLDFTKRTATIYALSGSACVNQIFSPPFFFVTNDTTVNTHQSTVSFTNDLIFYISDTPEDNILQYLKTKYDVDHVLLNPLNFYICPQMGKDMSRVLALETIAAYARAHPSIEPILRTKLLRDIVREDDAVAYVRATLLNVSLPNTGRAELIEISRSLDSTRLDVVTREIARILRKDLKMHALGVPIDTSAKNLLLTHNAIPSLYPVQSKTLGYVFPGSLEKFRGRFAEATELYTELRKTLSRPTIVDDLQGFARFEQSFR